MRRLQRDAEKAEEVPHTVVSGSTSVQPLIRADDPSRLIVEEITFEPGSHTIWHSHPYGQLLIVAAGSGWIQARDQTALPLSTGDTIWIEPGEDHWHGSSLHESLVHLSIQEHKDGQTAQLGESLALGAYPPTEEARS